MEAKASQNLAVEDDHFSLDFAFLEALDLAQALVTVWYKERLPIFAAEYRVLATEQEVRSLLYSNDEYEVLLMSRHDAILERLSDGALLQDEIKTKGAMNTNWVKGWEHNKQLVGQHIALQQWAVEHGLEDRPLGGALIETLIKGKRERDSEGLWRQQSPLIYAYVKRGDGVMVQDVYSHTWRRDWPRQLISEVMPVEQWVMSLPAEITTPKATVIPVARPDSYEIESAARQWGERIVASYEAVSSNAVDLDKHFPQNTEHCFRYGKCAFYEPCWNPFIGEDPIGSGLFVKREPNHPEGIDE